MLNARVVSTIYTHMYMCMYCNSVSLLYRDTRFCLVLGLNAEICRLYYNRLYKFMYYEYYECETL